MTDNPPAWRKSSHSGADGCVEVRADSRGVMVRRSGGPYTGAVFTRREWAAFIAGAKDGEFDYEETPDGQ